MRAGAIGEGLLAVRLDRASAREVRRTVGQTCAVDLPSAVERQERRERDGGDRGGEEGAHAHLLSKRRATSNGGFAWKLRAITCAKLGHRAYTRPVDRRPSFIAVALVGCVAACGSSRQDFVTPDAGGDGSIIGPGSDGTAPAPTVVGHLTGKVFAPEGTIPISGALVYLAVGKPATQTKGVYCDKCVELTATTAYTYSKADGTFDLGAYYEGDQWLVVQKGQFRRARPFTVKAPTQVVPAPLSTLPGKSNPDAGDEIPKMAVVQAQWDKIEVSLARLGLGVVTKDFLNQPQVKPSDANFDIVDPTLFDSSAKLAQYNIVFAGCSFSSGTTCDTSQPAGSSTVQKNLQDFVKAGGKLYTSDYSYELVRQPWPGFVHWDGETGTLGSACQSGAYDTTAQVTDPGLSAWLSALGDPTPTLKQSWTSIKSVSPQPGTDQDGKPTTITPKVWMSGNGKPMTVSFQNGCGRVLFSTYHTEASDQLLSQEKALLYVLLEVGVCVGTLPPPK